MKICHVIASLDAATGGPPMVACRLAAAQASMGHTVSIVTYASPEGGLPDLPAVTIPDFVKVQLQCIPVNQKSESIRGTEAKRYFQNRFSRSPLNASSFPSAHEEQDQLVHLHGVWEPILRQAARAARKAGIPYVIAPHGMLHPWSLSQHRWKKRLALKLGYGKMLSQAGFIHTLNEDETDALAPLGLNLRCKIIPNGVFLEEILPLPEPGSFHARHPELQGRPFFLFLSRLHYKKGLDRLGLAFEQIAHTHDDVDLVVAGPDGGAKKAFVQQMSQTGLQNRVHLVGPLWGRDKFSAMVDACCFCLPSRQEGFSVAILEALAAGLPVLISRACHFPQVAEFRAGQCLAMDQADDRVAARHLGDAMAEILDDPVQTQRMKRAGPRLVAGQFTWPKIAKQALIHYQALVAS